MITAPVVLFTFNRPEHTLRTLTALMKNDLAKDTELFIYSDGAKSNATEKESQKVTEVRRILKEKKWCKDVHIIESETNRGLANSLIAGVTEVVNQNGKAIVLEDDMISSKYFLRFMNDALNLYEKCDEVACISGYVFPVTKKLPETFFIKGADCWGWATWKRSWDLFQPDGNKLLSELKGQNLTTDFNFNNSYPYTEMLADQIEGKNDSWAIRWYASAFLKNKLVLYPAKSFIQNIGNDKSGFHSTATNSYDVVLSETPVTPVKISCIENQGAKKIIEGYFRKSDKSKGVSNTIRNKLNSLFKK